MRAMAEELFVVLSALGPDRPGLVARVTAFLTERGANIEESRMAILGGEFGLMLLASGAGEVIGRLEREREGLERETGMAILLRRTRDPAQHRQRVAFPCRVTAESLDR